MTRVDCERDELRSWSEFVEAAMAELLMCRKNICQS